MFGFIKKLKPVYEISEPLSVRERALRVFSKIEALDDQGDDAAGFRIPRKGSHIVDWATRLC